MQIVIADDSFQSIDGLTRNGFVISNKVNSCVQEHDSILECLGLLFKENVDQVAEEETVSHSDQLAVVVDDVLNEVSQYFLDTHEN